MNKNDIAVVIGIGLMLPLFCFIGYGILYFAYAFFFTDAIPFTARAVLSSIVLAVIGGSILENVSEKKVRLK